MAAPPELCPDSWPLVYPTCATDESPSPNSACDHLERLAEPLREVIINSAVEYLWRWTGRRFGLCEVSLRPCSEECAGWSTYQGWSGAPAGYPWTGASATGMYPVIFGGNWFNIICGRCNKDRCGCGHLSTIVLPGPADSVTEVKIDGETLDPAAYRLDNTGLARIDGGHWPRCQDMAADPETDPDTFLVSYMRGTPVPASGQLAAGALACELARQVCGDKGCRLPKRVQTVAREGVSITLPNDEAFFTNGSTGIWEIDIFLTSVQQDNKNRYSVKSPDVKPFRRVW